MNDQYYIQQVLNGNTAAFRVLVEKYQNRMLAVAFNVVKNRDEAADIVQDSFLQAYQKLNTFRGDAQFSTWLYRIVVNFALTRTRQKPFSKQTSQGYEGAADEGVQNNALNQLQQHERILYIQKALSQMPTNHAVALNLYYLDELSMAEVAQVMEIGVENAKVMVSRARKQFYAILQQELKHETHSLV